MVFDSPLSSSRRSKGHEDNNKETATKKQSLENKGAKLKSGDAKIGDVKKTQKINEKELKGKSKIGKMRKTLNKKSELGEQKEEETIQTEITSKSISDDKHDSVESTTSTENNVRTINNIVQDDKQTEGKNQVQNDMEDIIEDSQVKFKLGKGRLFKVKVEVNKIEDIKKVVQSKQSELGEKDEVEKRQEKDVQTEVTKKISNNTSNVETVNNNRSNSDTESTIQDVKSTEGKTQDDMEDIIENSQEFAELQKKSNEKQYFIKLNRIEDTFPLMKYHEATMEDEEVAKIVSNDCDSDDTEVPKYYVKGFEEVSIIEPKISTPAIENNLCDNEKDAVLEAQKVNDGLRFKSLLELSSPKSNAKRQMKFKNFSTQGRAAHMLGLVTKQARMEAESNVINIDDEPMAKKLKSKDTDNDVLLGKKEQGSVSKEVDKVTACSSRQEKIFSNMRSADYCSSPPIKLFSNLKNDGEKIFSKTDKSVDYIPIQTDTQVDKIGEEAMLEGDELPILEWSSANPPSLTASPSASILKRQRQSIPEPDPESTTPNKVISLSV